jgi:hypothetical protein
MRNPKEFKELVDSVDLIVHTRSPEKWILLDRETGETYQGNVGGYWDRLDPVTKNKTSI